MQKLIIDAVVIGKGEGLKMSNRFLTGVADLLLKLPEHPAFVMEVKQAEYGMSTLIKGHTFALDVTTPQKRFLRDWDKAGTPACVGSFIQIGDGVKGLRFAVYSLTEIEEADWVADSRDHKELGGPDDRHQRINEELRGFLETWGT